MNLFQLFKASLMEPKKQAAVRILTIGKILKFVFAIIATMAVISFFELAAGLTVSAQGLDGLLQYVEDIKWLLYPFALVFLFVSTTVYHFVKISIFAFIGLGMVKMRNRRGEYRHLWRTAALCVTIPTLVSFAFSFFYTHWFVSAATAVWTLIYLYLAVAYYPKMPQAQKKQG
ncbi:DUF1189 family protein [Planococcus sp. YIM B11945]|uniref:DUF1189 family protein n=1 Tax=Planococcus sp. YIM B11945 TaxID=3435410 RepID=UPI003D7E1DBA